MRIPYVNITVNIRNDLDDLMQPQKYLYKRLTSGKHVLFYRIML